MSPLLTARAPECCVLFLSSHTVCSMYLSVCVPLKLKPRLDHDPRSSIVDMSRLVSPPPPPRIFRPSCIPHSASCICTLRFIAPSVVRGPWSVFSCAQSSALVPFCRLHDPHFSLFVPARLPSGSQPLVLNCIHSSIHHHSSPSHLHWQSGSTDKTPVRSSRNDYRCICSDI